MLRVKFMLACENSCPSSLPAPVREMPLGLKIIFCCVRTTCVKFWKLIHSHAVTPRWLDDCKECIQSGWRNGVTAAPWHMKSQLRMLVALKAAFLENYLAVSTWIFNGSSIKCHEKKHQPFSLFGVRFGSQAIQISGWKSAWRWSGENELLTRLLLIMCSI